MNEASYHIPVLLQETVDGLAVQEGGVYVDVTFGGGGHTREILQRMNEGMVVAFDRDVDARDNLPEDAKLVFIGQDFQFIESALLLKRITKVDGILADLGISSHQIDTPERGFSYRFEAELDMRMDVRQETTAAQILNEAEEGELVRIFWNYGELKNARKVARNIVSRRIGAKISTTTQLENILQDCIPPRHRIKFLSQVYQALRIEVNQELSALETLLTVSLKLLKPGGRLS
ncbi:MAG: 16S rRNA (cytosine(1402)-N(4))-methyltransferase RsmH, partial [Bacteroidota bacterium]